MGRSNVGPDRSHDKISHDQHRKSTSLSVGLSLHFGFICRCQIRRYCEVFRRLTRNRRIEIEQSSSEEEQMRKIISSAIAASLFLTAANMASASQIYLPLYMIVELQNRPPVPGCPWDIVVDEFGDYHTVQLGDTGGGVGWGCGSSDPDPDWNTCSWAGRPDWHCP